MSEKGWYRVVYTLLYYPFYFVRREIMKIEVIHHATIKISADKIIYFDPYDIKEEYHDADYIFITHDHYDHDNKESIKKILKKR